MGAYNLLLSLGDCCTLVHNTMSVFSRPIPLELQMQVVSDGLSAGVDAVTLMLVCEDWKVWVDEIVCRAQVVEWIDSNSARTVVAHFERSKARPIFFGLVLHERWRKQQWHCIEKFAVDFFPRVESLGLEGDNSMVYDVINTFSPMLQASTLL